MKDIKVLGIHLAHARCHFGVGGCPIGKQTIAFNEIKPALKIFIIRVWGQAMLLLR